MLSKLIALVLTGSVSFGLGGNAIGLIPTLTEEEQADLSAAREAAVEVLTDDEVAFVATLEGKGMKDLTQEEREEVREIRQKIGEAILENIEDPELLAKVETNREVKKQIRNENRETHRNRNRNME